MGYKADGFVIRVKCYADADAAKQWLTTDVVVDTLLGPLGADGYLSRVTHVSHAFAPPELIGSIGSTDELRLRAASWRYDIVSLFAGDPTDPEFEIFLGLDPAGPRFAVGMAGVDPRFRADVAHWVRSWSDGLAASRVRFATARFEPARATYPRPTPPRASFDWPPGALDHYLGRAWHLLGAETAETLERLEQAPLPPGASRTIFGDVVHIAFATDLHDASAVASARTAHERWISPLVQAPPEPGWNEHGDGAVGPGRRRVVEGLTFYDDETQIGCQALVVFPDGSIEEERWAAAEAIVRAGALPDGTPVKALRLIFPRRADAIAMHSRARAAGFEMTIYGEGGQLWQVHPPPP